MSDYISGFGNHVATEAVTGALPVGQNSPQHVPFGLYAEQFSGSAFTAPRHDNRRTWFYRLRPSADHPAFDPYTVSNWLSAPMSGPAPSPDRLRWSPLPYPDEAVDFVDSLITYAATGDVATQTGVALHLYAATASMTERALVNADAEMVIVPQAGPLKLITECGVIDIAPLQIAVIPRGLKFRVELPDGRARGYVCENYGQPFRLPDLGPIGANGLANPRDFEAPVAAFEDIDDACDLIQKFQGGFWVTRMDHSPFDVVAWHGNNAPYRYDLRRFNAIGTVSFDHPDPSIFTVLTSPSEHPGTANCDFVIFPPRWMVAEHTFRPPWFHRNIMSEFMGLIEGHYDAKAQGFAPGGVSLHNGMNAHGPDKASYDAAIAADLTPQKYDGTMAFMFETRYVLKPAVQVLNAPHLQPDYDHGWARFEKAKLPK
ncbi:homogentisate 1,2-dioxygenase [Asticcacaulis endophyticus]|uniref:Homogentisate 1,2-dioxygenase n=1 Tax=Asticcacaulis endophyticus TaxID=1395890 RepID=A0A918PWC2_9CAUL|nr:homogentisate 1,2-dioxygenase [Asticcacaulis endophyticus]GGZ24061.1 homogentisate 1,2-dioxygenase [Asticcacaulis endophyticus]